MHPYTNYSLWTKSEETHCSMKDIQIKFADEQNGLHIKQIFL